MSFQSFYSSIRDEGYYRNMSRDLNINVFIIKGDYNNNENTNLFLSNKYFVLMFLWLQNILDRRLLSLNKIIFWSVWCKLVRKQHFYIHKLYFDVFIIEFKGLKNMRKLHSSRLFQCMVFFIYYYYYYYYFNIVEFFFKIKNNIQMDEFKIVPIYVFFFFFFFFFFFLVLQQDYKWHPKMHDFDPPKKYYSYI